MPSQGSQGPSREPGVLLVLKVIMCIVQAKGGQGFAADGQCFGAAGVVGAVRAAARFVWGGAGGGRSACLGCQMGLTG